MTSSIHYRLDDIYPEFLDLLQKYGIDKFCVETFMSMASDQGMLHSEFQDGYPPSEYELLFENMSNLVRSAKFDREIVKLTNESVMKQVFSQEQIKDKGLKDEVRREIVRFWTRNKLNQVAKETTEPFVGKKVKKEIKELLESKKE